MLKNYLGPGASGSLSSFCYRGEKAVTAVTHITSRTSRLSEKTSKTRGLTRRPFFYALLNFRGLVILIHGCQSNLQSLKIPALPKLCNMKVWSLEKEEEKKRKKNSKVYLSDVFIGDLRVTESWSGARRNEISLFYLRQSTFSKSMK